MYHMPLARTAILFSATIFISLPAAAQFWDQSFVNGAARSDFDSPQIGTSQSPLSYGECLFTDNNVMYPCSGQTTWPVSNWDSFGDVTSGFWVLSANDEPWKFSTTDGPPNQSHAIGEPGSPGFGFHYGNIQGDGLNDGGHIIINTDLLYSSQYDDWVDAPFLSIGAERDRGNNGIPPATLNGLDHWMYGAFQYLQFKAQLWASQDGEHGGSYRHAGLYIVAEWGQTGGGVDHPRGIFLMLHEDADSDPSIDGTLLPHGYGTLDWNWPFEQSFFYPGADWFFVTIGHLSSFCPQAVIGSNQSLSPTFGAGNLTSYKFHLTHMFDCIEQAYSPWTDPFPTNEIVDVRGIHWYVEGYAAAAQDTPSVVMWLQVHDPRTMRF